uniref:Uncharacterized protein n=1 Tax=Haptolina ericina TaxID=156174 RepID=A0A7S3BB88_9EUKA|mmetsp:Transcript_55763/g.124567  ORF Transcript_55763/g.124567 Transcript_55763/m.124567 type:complete len:152 (+) Transcript_55763:2-457(+)
MGGFWWQLMDGGGMKGLAGMGVVACTKSLRARCVAKPAAWGRLQMFTVPHGGEGVTEQGFTDYTAEFLLTRGPYALLGYSWCGCTNGAEARPRAKEWDSDFGEPENGAPCAETGDGTGVFVRQWTKAAVSWDCNAGHGVITAKRERPVRVQ